MEERVWSVFGIGDNYMHVVGGTYYEIIKDPQRKILLGSGFRAAACLRHFGDVSFHTYFPEQENSDLVVNAKSLGVELTDVNDSEIARKFVYETPVSKPLINNWDSDDSAAEIVVDVGEPVLRFGMLEREARVKGNKVIYDPQNPLRPHTFDANGSSAKELVIVANHQEVKSLFGGENYDAGIKQYLEDHAEAICVVMKYGPFGARVFTPDGEVTVVPAYRTKDVFSIGTGDVFSAYFSRFWGVDGMELVSAANYASKAVAAYVSSWGSIQNLTTKELEELPFQPVKAEKKLSSPIYLAGPFFTLADKLMLKEIKHAFSSMDVPFFSPIDDVGTGTPEQVYKGDIDGLEKCSAVFANICGLDTGTIYEIGYARAIGKPVVLFAQDCKDKDLTMLRGGGCRVYTDFTSAVYNCVWDALENDG